MRRSVAKRCFANALGHGMCCVLAAPTLLLAACGGQASAPSVQTVSKVSDPANLTAQPPTVLAGAYGADTGTDFVSFVWTLGGMTHWIALYMPKLNPATYPPVIYTGSINLGTQGAASGPITSFDRQYQLRKGSAVIAAASDSTYHIALSGVSLSSSSSPTFSARKLSTSSNFNRAWRGTWSDANSSGSISSDAPLTLTGGHASPQFGNCSMDLSLQATQDAGGEPYIAATMVIRPSTGCARSVSAGSTASLSGIAFIHTPPAGVDQLEIILADGTGSGISFRGKE